MINDRFDRDYFEIYAGMTAEPVEEVLDKRSELLLILRLPEYETDPTWWAIRLFLTKN